MPLSGYVHTPACVKTKKKADQIVIALSSHPPQITRRRRPRHRSSHSLRGLCSRLSPREGLLLYLPDLLLRRPSHVHLQPALHHDPQHKSSHPTLLRLCPNEVLQRLPPTCPLPPSQLLSRRLPPPLRRPLHRRTLLLLKAGPRHRVASGTKQTSHSRRRTAKGTPPSVSSSTRDILLLRTPQHSYLQCRPPQRTPRLPRHPLDKTPRPPSYCQRVLRAFTLPPKLGLGHLDLHPGQECRPLVPC